MPVFPTMRALIRPTAKYHSLGRPLLSSKLLPWRWPAPYRPFYTHRTTAAPVPSRPTRHTAADYKTTKTLPPDEVGRSPDPMPEVDSTVAGNPIDWSSSFHGLSTVSFDREVIDILMAPINPEDIEIKPDGILYLPEIKYRRILHKAFGPGGWGLAPRGDLQIGEKTVTREYALVVNGRYVGQARGECANFNGADGVATAGEGCKSNALMRCCKDLGIASELWDPRYIRVFKKEHCREIWVENVVSKKRRQIWLRKDSSPVYPFAIATGSFSKKTVA